jgi:hypothetical protein
MQRIGSRFRNLLLAIFAFALFSCANAAAPLLVTDPLFGIAFNPSRTHFETGDPLLDRCPNLVTKQWTRRLLIFGRTRAEEREYIVAGGLMERRDSKATEPDKNGVLLRLTSTGCTLLGPAREAFETPAAYADVISDADLQALAKDASERYTKAFGSRTALLEAVRKQRIDLNKAPSPILRNAIAGKTR